MPTEPGSERYGARRPMARPRYGLCGGSDLCAQPAPCSVEQTGVIRGPPNPKSGVSAKNESSRRKIESFHLFSR